VLLPGVIATQQSFGLPTKNPTGLPLSDFTFAIADPNSCTVGFLPPSQWRNPADTTTIDTPDGLYCKLPQDSPIAVRGARNYPCMGHPGKRAPTVELCNDPQGYQPLAMREHSLGPYPFDPNLISQGVPPDDRVDFGDRIFAPVGGTPMPPGAVPPGTPPGPPNPLTAPMPPVEAPLAPAAGEVPPVPHGPPPGPVGVPPPDGAVPAAPSGFGGNASGGAGGPSVAFAHYDPRTGRYLTPDGQLQQLTISGTGSEPKSWKDLLPT
jgi:hypothetical protein